MVQTERDFDLLEAQCSAAVAALQSRYGWQLLDQASFARHTLALLVNGSIADVQRAAIHIYCKELYAACSGLQGAERQNIAYGELFRYLYDIARRRYPQLAADAAQEGIERVFLAFDRCHDPGTFLAFAIQQLRDAARALQRHAQRQPESLDAPVIEAEPLGYYVADQRQPELSLALIADELHQRFKALVAAFLQAHPRAEQQIAALQLKYIDGLDDTTISQRLGVSVNSVYVLRSRAIKRLQNDRRWRALAAELGILPDASES